jgi:DNA-binding winged helix-turn-helix (wHTH) protein
MPRGDQIPDTNHGAFRIGEWLVEPELGRLRRDDHNVHLELRIMDVLVYLACHAPRVVTRQQIIDGVWDGGYISDNTLTHAIAEIRRALGDNAGQPEYIETIHCRGYRLLQPVTDLEGRSPLAFGRPSRFRVLVDQRNIQLREGKNLIGRTPGASVCIHSLQVSRQHALIDVENTRAFVEDLGSKNGTLLNGRQVNGRRRLKNGDRIILGEDAVSLQIIEAGSSVAVDRPDLSTPTAP